ncbi:ABC transporter ATP-binding protein/permease [Sphingosinicella sp.]|uniref:ABCB family ABC transporter ATP-binding protein/permease n=1 Tax=Sphingosinicella sp. TaxID=1917971 RepID=UPI0025F61239|nr:ABC transporter ATP-binding protein/permease [Sphingosinicella sp.]
MTTTSQQHPLRRFLPYLWPADKPGLKVRVVFALILVLIAKATMLIMPFAYKGVIDSMATPTNQGFLLGVGLVFAYAAARFGGVFFDNIRNVIFERVGQTAGADLAGEVFTRIHDLSLRFHLERRTGALTRIIERGTKSVDTMLYFLAFNIAPTILELIAVCVIFQIKMGFEIVAATLVIVALYIWFTRRVTEWRSELRRRMVDTDNRTTQRAVDSLLNYETVKYYSAEALERQRYSQSLQSYASAAIKSENSLAALNIGQSLITNIMMAGAMAYTVWGWSQGKFTVGDVVLVNTLLMQLFRPLDMLGWVYREIKQGLIDMEAMFGLLDTVPEIADAPGAPPLAVSVGAVRFENVDFGYDPERQILHGVSFEIPPGDTVAIVGESGAGKSTLSRILYRFYDIQTGRVTIDDQDIRTVTQASVRAAIGIVPQDTVLFNDTIGYNIGYGRAGATQMEIEAAARQAQIHDFIVSLPQGYDTVVGERGLKLSGGEKQRVAIARTILKDPPILILDEATSALDSRTEAAIQDALSNVSARRTTLVIAHRLSTIVDADEILVMDKGRIVERGRHDGLLATNGLYAEMWMRQQTEADDLSEAAE